MSATSLSAFDMLKAASILSTKINAKCPTAVTDALDDLMEVNLSDFVAPVGLLKHQIVHN
jgi:hypothetical protein